MMSGVKSEQGQEELGISGSLPHQGFAECGQIEPQTPHTLGGEVLVDKTLPVARDTQIAECAAPVVDEVKKLRFVRNCDGGVAVEDHPKQRRSAPWRAHNEYRSRGWHSQPDHSPAAGTAP